MLILKSKKKNVQSSKKENSPKKFNINTPLYKFNYLSFSSHKMPTTKEKTDESSSLKKSKKILFNNFTKREFKNLNSKQFSSISCFNSNVPSNHNKSKNEVGKFSINKNNTLSTISLNNSIRKRHILYNKTFLVDKINKINLCKNPVRKENKNRIKKNMKKNIGTKKLKCFSTNTKINKIKFNPFNKNSSIIIKTERIFNELKNIKIQIAKSLEKNFKKIKNKRTNNYNNYKIQDFTFRKNSKYVIRNNQTNINKNKCYSNYINNFVKKIRKITIKNTINSNLLSLHSDDEIDNKNNDTAHFSTLIEY